VKAVAVMAAAARVAATVVVATVVVATEAEMVEEAKAVVAPGEAMAAVMGAAVKVGVKGALHSPHPHSSGRHAKYSPHRKSSD